MQNYLYTRHVSGKPRNLATNSSSSQIKHNKINNLQISQRNIYSEQKNEKAQPDPLLIKNQHLHLEESQDMVTSSFDKKLSHFNPLQIQTQTYNCNYLKNFCEIQPKNQQNQQKIQKNKLSILKQEKDDPKQQDYTHQQQSNKSIINKLGNYLNFSEQFKQLGVISCKSQKLENSPYSIDLPSIPQKRRSIKKEKESQFFSKQFEKEWSSQQSSSSSDLQINKQKQHDNQVNRKSIKNQRNQLQSNQNIQYSNNRNSSKTIARREICTNYSKNYSNFNRMFQNNVKKQFLVSIIEHSSNQLAMAIYNLSTGEIHLCQMIERLTYTQTISTIYRFYPVLIIYPDTQQKSPLITKISKVFQGVQFRQIKRNIFDQTKGYATFCLSQKKQQTNPDAKFLAFSAFNALTYALGTFYDLDLCLKALVIRWHRIEDTLIIQQQTLVDLEIFFNTETKKKQDCFIEKFKCITRGGFRLLRANFLQPLSSKQKIEQRQQLLQIMLSNSGFFQFFKTHLNKFRQFQTMSVKIMYNPRQQSNQIVKSYLYSLVHITVAINNIQLINTKWKQFGNLDSSITKKSLETFGDKRIYEIKQMILKNFDLQVLRTFENNTLKIKRQKFIFLLKDQEEQNQILSIYRVRYTQAVKDLHKMLQYDIDRTGLKISICYNGKKGYYYNCKNTTINKLEAAFKSKIIQFTVTKKGVSFLTTETAPIIRKIKQNEELIMHSSSFIINKIITFIQQKIECLFNVNYQISLIDMVISFVSFIRSNPHVNFYKPTFFSGGEGIRFLNMVPVWFPERNLIQREIFLSSVINMQFTQKEYQNQNAVVQIVSFGYCIILSHIGCFVPAKQFKTSIFRYLFSKFQNRDSIECNLSGFQSQMLSLNNIVEQIHQNKAMSLVLLDEVLKGTNQIQQLAISIAFIKKLRKMNGFVLGITGDESLLQYLNQLHYVSLSKIKMKKDILSLMKETPLFEHIQWVFKNYKPQQIISNRDNNSQIKKKYMKLDRKAKNITSFAHSQTQQQFKQQEKQVQEQKQKQEV